MPSISYAVTASTEVEELPKLIRLIQDNLRPEDAVFVQLDSGRFHPDLPTLLAKDFSAVDVVKFPLNNHFGNFKNNLKKYCTKDYIFQIDADELPSESLLTSLPGILEDNASIGLFHVPRVNTVSGITQKHLEHWGWNLNGKGWVNWPDWQPRIIKNSTNVHWKLHVHEVIEGYGSQAFLPPSEEFCLYHPKSIQKQETQNSFYKSI